MFYRLVQESNTDTRRQKEDERIETFVLIFFSFSQMSGGPHINVCAENLREVPETYQLYKCRTSLPQEDQSIPLQEEEKRSVGLL